MGILDIIKLSAVYLSKIGILDTIHPCAEKKYLKNNYTKNENINVKCT